VLHQTTKLEFDCLLEYFYFGYIRILTADGLKSSLVLSPHRLKSDYAPDNAAWVAIFSISSRLLFDDVQAAAIRELTKRINKIDPIVLVALLSNETTVTELRVQAYMKLVERKETLSVQEAQRLPLLDTVTILRSREAYYSGDNWNGNPHRSMMPDEARQCFKYPARSVVKRELELALTGTTGTYGCCYSWYCI